MNDFYKALKTATEKGEPIVAVTIIRFHGSAPRGTGAQMFVNKDGSILGTVGGGAIEYDAQRQAAECFQTGVSFIKDYILKPNETEDLGMICGGDASLYFQYLNPEKPDIKTLLLNLTRARERGENTWLLTKWTDPSDFSMELVTEEKGGYPTDFFKQKGHLFKEDRVSFFTLPIIQRERVYIFGGGHVARELVPVLSHLDFKCVVLDDREEFASKAVFPTAEEVIVSDFEDIKAALDICPQDYVVIMTRGHQNDYLVERQILKTGAHYIGVIGSRRKTQTINEKLMADGFDRETLDKVYTPIGKDIKAETPAEIAISIAAELIEVRAGSR